MSSSFNFLGQEFTIKSSPFTISVGGKKKKKKKNGINQIFAICAMFKVLRRVSAAFICRSCRLINMSRKYRESYRTVQHFSLHSIRFSLYIAPFVTGHPVYIPPFHCQFKTREEDSSISDDLSWIRDHPIAFSIHLYYIYYASVKVKNYQDYPQGTIKIFNFNYPATKQNLIHKCVETILLK